MRYAFRCCTCEVVAEPAAGYRYTGKYFDKDETHSVFIPKAHMEAYRAGAHIQEAMPDLSADDREFLISGMSPEGFDEVCKEDE
jgi:hypothetical protein